MRIHRSSYRVLNWKIKKDVLIFRFDVHSSTFNLNCNKAHVVLNFTGLPFAESGYIFTLFAGADWQEAVSICEFNDRKMAVLDTTEKLAALQEQGM